MGCGQVARTFGSSWQRFRTLVSPALPANSIPLVQPDLPGCVHLLLAPRRDAPAKAGSSGAAPSLRSPALAAVLGISQYTRAHVDPDRHEPPGCRPHCLPGSAPRSAALLGMIAAHPPPPGVRHRHASSPSESACSAAARASQSRSTHSDPRRRTRSILSGWVRRSNRVHYYSLEAPGIRALEVRTCSRSYQTRSAGTRSSVRTPPTPTRSSTRIPLMFGVGRHADRCRSPGIHVRPHSSTWVFSRP